MTSSIAPYCVSAYVIRLTSEGARYLLIRRCGKYLNGTWQMVTGGIEPGETASAAALREIREETGLIPSSLYVADAVETFYMQANDKITFAPVFVSFVEDAVVRLSPKEHDAYEWLTFEEAKERIVWAEQKRVITHIQHAFILNKPNPLFQVKITALSPPAKPMISRTGVYAAIMQNQKLLLVKQRRGPHAGKWDFPGGGIESGETIEGALRRELIEEVGIEFSEMTPFNNLTAISEGIDEQGNPYDFHQIGLIYQIHGISQSNSQTAEMEYTWMDYKQMETESVAPFVCQFLILCKIDSFV